MISTVIGRDDSDYSIEQFKENRTKFHNEDGHPGTHPSDTEQETVEQPHFSTPIKLNCNNRKT